MSTRTSRVVRVHGRLYTDGVQATRTPPVSGWMDGSRGKPARDSYLSSQLI
jgi:hypothetical protein